MAVVVDLDEMVKLRAITADQIANGLARGLSYEVDWSRVKIATEMPDYEHEKANRKQPKSLVLVMSKLENHSSEEQAHAVTAQNMDSSSGSDSLHQSFSLHGRTKVDLPGDVLKATPSFSQKRCMISAGTATSNANSNVFVPKETCRTVEENARETEFSAPFSADTVLSGKVHVRVLDKNGSFVRSVAPLHISEIVQQHYNAKRLMPDFVKIEGRSARITGRGLCKFTYATEQHMTMSSN